MRIQAHIKPSIRLTVAGFTALVFAATSALAQVTLPSPTSPNFDNDGGGGDGMWTNAANWDTDAIPLNTEDAKINDGLTAFYDADIGLGGAIALGTLTIGVGSTFEYDPAGDSGSDFTDGNDIYFANNSQLTISGFFNSNFDLRVPAASSATVEVNGRPRGTVEGEGNLEFIINGSWIQQRWQAANFTGDMTFTPSSGTRNLREFGGWSGSNQMLGQGNNTIGDNVYVDYTHADNKIPDNATLTLVGDGGSAAYKLNMARVDTIANLVFDSPTGTADTIRRNSGDTLTVTNTVTFQGTAGTVTINDLQAAPSGNALVAGNMRFAGAGPWTVQGDGILAFTGASTITNDVDVTINNPIASSFTKVGTGKLTLGGLSSYDDTVTVSAGTLSLTNSSSVPVFGTLSISNSAALNLDYTGTGTVLLLYFDGAQAAAGVWGAPTSGAPNTTNLITGTGFINHNNGVVDNIFFWDGTDLPGDGDLASDGGSGTWNTTTSNWDIGYAPHTTWGNTTADEAIFGGTAGTVTLGEDITIGDLTINDASSGNKYTIQDNTLNFSGGTITVNSSQGGNNNYQATFTCAITGTPAVVLNHGENNRTTFGPTSGTAILGTISGGGMIELGGSTTGNSIAGTASSKIRLAGGTWTISGDAVAYEHFLVDGTLICEGLIRCNNRTLNLNDNVTLVINGSMETGHGSYPFSWAASGGTLKGTGVMKDDVITVPAAGILAPGYPTGTLTITNNHCIIDGTLAITIDGAQVSTLAVDPGFNLGITNATLDVTGATVPGEYVIATYGDATKLVGEPFASTNGLPDDAYVEYDYNSDTAIAIVIPPPAGAVILLR